MTTSLSIMPIAAAHKQAAHDASTPVSSQDLAVAVVRNAQHRPLYSTGQVFTKLYYDTPERARWRTFFNAAYELPGVALAVTFIKSCGESRTMLCQPMRPETEYTKRYVQVWDIDAGGVRRVNLDAIAKVTMETHSIPAERPDL